MALYEYEETIPTLFTTIMEFANNNSDLVQSMSNKNSLWHFIIDSETKVFNKCHFWSNFQVRHNDLCMKKETKRKVLLLHNARLQI